MKLYSDRGNPFLLRILATKNLADVRLTLEYINFEDRTKFHCQGNTELPVLETDRGNLLNSPNSICRYLLNLNRSSDDVPDPYKEAVVDQWVEWESKSLQPVLFNHLVKYISLGRQNRDSGHVEDLVKLLRHANQALSSNKYFSGDKLGLADVILWGSLHPLFIKDSNFSGIVCCLLFVCFFACLFLFFVCLFVCFFLFKFPSTYIRPVLTLAQT